MSKASKKTIERLTFQRDAETRERVAHETHATLLEQALAAERAKAAAAPPPAAPAAPPPPPSLREQLRNIRNPTERIFFSLDNEAAMIAEAEARR